MTVSHLFSYKMAVTMALFWVSLVCSVIGSYAAGEFSVLSSPNSLVFSGSKATSETQRKEIISASLGLSVEENTEWEGLYVTDPFNTPEAVVNIYVDGVSSLGDFIGKLKTYPLIVDEFEPDTFEAVVHRIKQRFTSGGNKLVNIRLSDPSQLASSEFVDAFGDFKVPKVPKQSLSHLKLSVEEDYQFLFELEILKAITQKVSSGTILPDNVVDLFNFRFTSLHALSDYHGANSLVTKEAKKLLGAAIEDLSKAFTTAYDGSVLVTAVVTDVAHTRRIRAAENETPAAEINIDTRDSDEYSAEYPAIFNIILWFGVVFSFTLIAIVYAIMDMDPGRDSIIYRMTNTRMKKDN